MFHRIEVSSHFYQRKLRPLDHATCYNAQVQGKASMTDEFIPRGAAQMKEMSVP